MVVSELFHGRASVIALSLCLLACLSVGTVRASTGPLLLQLADVQRVLGGGFRAGTVRTLHNGDLRAGTVLNGVRAGDFARHDRILGYFATFLRHGAAPHAGAGLVISEVDVYRSGSGPVWALGLQARQRPVRVAGLRMQLRHDRMVGAASVEATFSEPGGPRGALLHGASVAYREGRYTATVSLSGGSGVRLADAVALARALDIRLRRAR